jgi:xylulokinase
VTSDVTVGIDIGTTSVKALAVNGAGDVLARARVEHGVESPAADVLQHDADLAWRANVVEAYRQVRETVDQDVAAVNVAAMVPSLCAVDDKGRPITPGLLYGDHRGGRPAGANPSESGELVNFLRWCAVEAPDAAGYWPAQAVANHALCGVGGIDSVTAMTTLPLFDFTSWDAAVAAEAGARVDQLPVIVSGATPLGATPDGAVVGGGTIDAFGEQLVAGSDQVGDVLVIVGTTLIVWAVIDEWREVPGLWTVPHTSPGAILIGGASNAGGLFRNWAHRLTSTDTENRNPPSAMGPGDPPLTAEGRVRPDAVPVWEPYVRGERVPLHDPDRRAVLHDLRLTTGAAECRRAADEATGFVIRQLLDLGQVDAQRIVATGGGVRVTEWVQAIADATALPVDVVAVPEGGAYGTAYLARVAAGLEADASDAGRWAATDRRVEPDGAWIDLCRRRYERFRAVCGV